MNSVMERWVGSVRRECLDRLLMTGEGHFPNVLGENERRYNHYRPHRSRDRQPPQPPQPPQPAVAAARLDRVRLKREEVLNGLINEYRRAAQMRESRRSQPRARVSAPHKPAARISA